MKTIESLSKDEKSLLLYFETAAVDQSGSVQSERMNDADREIASRWTKEGFVEFGRISSEHLSRFGSAFVHMTDEAWELAHALRRERAERLWSKRAWTTTAEKRAEAQAA